MIQQDIYIAGVRLSDGSLRAIAKSVGGFTIIDTHGGWLADDGRVVIEDSYILRTINSDARKQRHVEAIVVEHARRIGEETILVHQTVLDSATMTYIN